MITNFEKIKKIKNEMFETEDGLKYSELIKKLMKLLEENNRDIIAEIIIEYFNKGKLPRWRYSSINSYLVELVKEGEEKYISIFEEICRDKENAYYGIAGLLKTAGKKSYITLIEMINDKEVDFEARVVAVKRISRYSKQKFERDLPDSSSEWQESDIRLDEINEWYKNGCPDGEGYEPPKVHPSLLNPKQPFELSMAKLEKKLKKMRSMEPSTPANPTNYLVMTEEKDREEIIKRWNLPKKYIEFLTNYSPLNVTIYSSKFENFLRLFGVKDLIEGQLGYSHKSVEEPIEDWNPNLVVIASDGGDPFVLDLSKIKKDDAPVYTAEHGGGEWEFEEYASSFAEFIEKISM